MNIAFKLRRSSPSDLSDVYRTDSGIRRAAAIAFAREGPDVAISYFLDKASARHDAQRV